MNRRRKALPKREMRRIIEAAKNDRDKWIITVFLRTGMRASELCDLKLDDIDVKTGEIRVKGRDAKVRVVRYPQENLSALVGWLNKKRNGARGSDRVLVSRSGEKLSLMQIHKIVHLAAKRAGILGVTPHKLRHTFASNSGHSKP